MSYTALYRKFRPREFEDVKGQDHIVTTLKNQIRTDRIGHAYLFTGTRGTGKTTVAKIFARAVNCEHPVDGSPCGECESCRRIAGGTSMNVIEIDAASNNGVSNIRDIIEEVAYAPTEGKYKVYIIDEVHMLSIGAFNALLKTLEEPPAYVIFILATTEVHKIPITILSRCQRYDFHRISIDTIAARLRELMDQEQVDVEERALRYIAKAADGSMRDALSLLDQCIAFYLGQTLTYDNVLSVLGAVDTEVFGRLLNCLMAEDVNGCISLLEEMVVEGRDLGQFVTDFTWYLRNLLLVKAGEQMEDVLEVSGDQLAVLKEQAERMDDTVLMRYIRIFSDLANQLRYAAGKRVLVEIALIKLCRPQMEEDYSALVQRVDSVEHRLEEGIPVAVPPNNGAGGAVGGADGTAAGETKKKKELPEAVPEEIAQVAREWPQILGQTTGLLRTTLGKAMVTVSDNQELLLVFSEPPGSKDCSGDILQNTGALDELKGILEEHVGKKVPVKVEINRSGENSRQLYTDAVDYFAKTAHIDIEEEDF